MIYRVTVMRDIASRYSYIVDGDTCVQLSTAESLHVSICPPPLLSVSLFLFVSIVLTSFVELVNSVEKKKKEKELYLIGK